MMESINGESLASSLTPMRLFGIDVEDFTEDDFQIPELEVNMGTDFQTQQENKRTIQMMESLKGKIESEKQVYQDLDNLAKAPDEAFRRKKGVEERKEAIRRRRGAHEGEAEIRLLKHVISRKPGDMRTKANILQKIVDGTYTGDADEIQPSTIDHPKLGSVQEKLEDDRQTQLEQWCSSHGKDVRQKYTNKEKRMLRRWFQQLDNDGSGEVNVEELQDPMLSSGILKTREQVVRVLANVDKNNTMGIDFEEFLLALSSNKLADQSKLKRLQEMSSDPIFDIVTLLTADRREKLVISILQQCEQRQLDLEKLYKKYEKPRLSRREYDQFLIEKEKLDEDHMRSQQLHQKYVYALAGIVQEKTENYVEQTKRNEEEWRKRMRRMEPDEFYRSITAIRMSSPTRKDALIALKEVVPPPEDYDTSLNGISEMFSASISLDEPSVDSRSSRYTLGSTYVDALQSTSSIDEIESYRKNPYKVYAPLPTRKKYGSSSTRKLPPLHTNTAVNSMSHTNLSSSAKK